VKHASRRPRQSGLQARLWGIPAGSTANTKGHAQAWPFVLAHRPPPLALAIRRKSAAHSGKKTDSNKSIAEIQPLSLRSASDRHPLKMFHFGNILLK